MNHYDKFYKNNARLDPKEEVDLFLKKHEATGELSTRRLYQRRQPMRYQDWINDGTPIPFDLTVEREPMVEINMPQHQFQSLVEREKLYDHLEQEASYYKSIVDQYRADERVRDNNPAVKKAWMNYLMLLELAR